MSMRLCAFLFHLNVSQRRTVLTIVKAAILSSLSIFHAAEIFADAPVMPKGFEDVKLGMSETHLAAARPKAEPFQMLGRSQPRRPDHQQLYIEELSGPAIFGQAVYAFDKDRLCMMRLLNPRGNADPAVGLARVLQGAIKKWGDKYQKVVSESDSNEYSNDSAGADSTRNTEKRRLAGLLWNIGGVEVLVLYTPSTAAEEWRTRGKERLFPGLDVGVTIFDRSCVMNSLSGDWLSRIDLAKGRERAAMFVDLKRRVRPPLFE